MNIDQYAADNGHSAKHLQTVLFAMGWAPHSERPVPELKTAFDSIEEPISVGDYCKRKKIKAAVRDQVIAERNWLPESESGITALDQIFAAAGADVTDPPDEPPAE